MGYLTRRPRPPLRQIVDRLWHVESSTPHAEPDTICPDGRAEIIVHVGAPMRERRDGIDRSQPRHLLVGQMDHPVTVAPTGAVRMVGATLAPAALYQLLPMPQDRLAGQIVDLESIWGRWTRQTAERIAAVTDPGLALDCFERSLEALLPFRAHDAAPMALVVTRLERSGGHASVAALAAQCGLGRRQFERRFREQIGLPPRLFGRIVRFQRAFHALGRESGASIAARCGYADQAHLVREVRRFAGLTPTLLAEADGLTAFFRS
jgi:AraC-like DNA-binding protein